jgi:hypothetical protein
VAKSLWDRVDDAFSEDGKTSVDMRQDAIAYCKAMSDRWTEASASMNRTALLMVVAAAVFQLLTMRIAEKVEIAGFEFKNVDTIRVFLPAFVAYLYLEFIILGIRCSDMRNIYTFAMAKAYPRVFDNDLEVWLAPPPRALFNPTTRLQPEIETISERLAFHVLWGVSYLLVVLPVGFLGYAFWWLFEYGSISGWHWLAMILAIVFVTAGGVMFLIWELTSRSI